MLPGQPVTATTAWTQVSRPPATAKEWTAAQSMSASRTTMAIWTRLPSRQKTLLRPVKRPAYGRVMAVFMNMVRHVRLRAVEAGVGLASAH